MPNREAPSRIVPRVFAEDSGGYARPAKCMLCGYSISKRTLDWWSLPSDPPQLVRPLHRGCKREYALFKMALPLPPEDVTPTL